MVLSARALHYITGNDIMMGFSFLVVVLRFYLRVQRSRRGLWWDDFFILLSLILAIGYGASVNVSMGYYGWDQHIWDIPSDKLTSTIKSYLLAKDLFILTTSSIRMSLLCFYLSLVKDIGAKALRRTIYACIVMNGVMCITFCLISIFECRPISAFWAVPKPDGSHCMNDGHVVATMGGFLCFADVVVNLLPLSIVAKLRIPMRRRVSIGALLSLGGVATVAGIVREYWIYRTFIATEDSTWEALPLWICTNVEIYVALLCACAPALKPLYIKVKFQKPLPQVRRRHQRVLSPDAELGPPGMGHEEHHIFDGTSFSNVTRISASHDRFPHGHDKSRMGHLKQDSCASNSVGIHVVTHFQLTETTGVGHRNTP